MKNMKQILASIILGLTATVSLAQGKPISIDGLSIVNLKEQGQASSVTLRVPYPGPIFGAICGIRFLTSTRVPYELNINPFIVRSKTTGLPLLFPSESRGIRELLLPYDSTDNYYVEEIVIETKDGSSLKRAVEKIVGQKNTIYVTSTTCQ
ncbi:MAG: hypothetical protein NT027_14535 [Proteobacteria bacterium]|nr:hypothetical protein [Pseudomonadota bacterium]